MTTIVMDKSATRPPTTVGIKVAGEVILRLTGAALMVLATLVVVRTLAPPIAGIYFEGFLVAFALAALLRGKYEMLILRYVLGECAEHTCIPVIDLLAALGRRIAVRCVLVCGALLVITADLDIMEPRLRSFLSTFLPFVLAVPFVAVAMFLSAALRAASRSVGSTIISAYAINLAIIVTGVLISPEDALSALSWAFFGGAIASSAIGILLVREVFPTAADRGSPKPCVADWRQIYGAAAIDYGIAGIAYSGLQWGSLCVLAMAGPALQIAGIAVCSRLAQIVELLMPSVVFVPMSLEVAPRLMRSLRTERGRLLGNLALSVVAASGLALILILVAPQLLGQFGSPYAELTGLFALMLAAQWVNAAARPALRFMTTHHYKPVLAALCVSAAVALAITFSQVGSHGAYAAAVAALVGTLILNAHSLLAALRKA